MSRKFDAEREVWAGIFIGHFTAGTVVIIATLIPSYKIKYGKINDDAWETVMPFPAYVIIFRL
jgi:hypothetical protein